MATRPQPPALSLPSWKSRASLAGVRNPLNAQFFSQQQSQASAAQHERCAYFLSRKKRLCSHRAAAPGLKFCTLHEPSRLLQLQRDSECRHVLREIVSAVEAGSHSLVLPSHAVPLSVASSATAAVAPAAVVFSAPGSEMTPVLPAGEGDAARSASRGNRKRRRNPRTSAPKRMVNPFSTFYSQSIALPQNWRDVFSDPALPLTIDVGCARGTLLDKLAARHPDQNFLGIEIRPKMVEEALERTQHLRNLHFVAGKFSAEQAARLLDSLQPGVIYAVCFQFPDPWRKKKQLRRRVLQPGLAAVLAEKLPRGCHIYISSDVKDVCEGMLEILRVHPTLVWVKGPGSVSNETNRMMGAREKVAAAGAGAAGGVDGSAMDDDEGWWLKQSFLGEPSERGLVCEQDWRIVWRGVFTVQ